jgi:hypothetical protein
MVTGIVRYNEKLSLSVIVDVGNNKITTEGTLRGIEHIIKPFKQKNYLDMIRSEAEGLILNGIDGNN